jgi:sugar phosphate isomerase/epimerase
MELLIFRSLWTNGFDLATALADCADGPFDGVEGPAPDAAIARAKFAGQLADAGVPFIAEIATGGGYVPGAGLTAAQHLEEFRRKAGAALECRPLFITALAGSDAWPLAEAVEFFGAATDAARVLGVSVTFETHRSRPTFNPWSTAELLRQLPELRLTCDFSHWCSVCERLVLDEEPALLALCAARARHVHGRVGYDQGAQVPHPAAPEYRHAREAHERWWRAIADARLAAGERLMTITPEYGPDGYLHQLPFTGAPVASLDEINHWAARRLRELLARPAVAVAA